MMYAWNEGQLVASWKYQSGDWVVEPGLPDHHLRIIERFIDANGAPWYTIFDTSLRVDYGDYRWRHADELEPRSRLKARPDPDAVPAILARTLSCCGIGWSMLARTDCESIQGWIQSGNEDDRWSPQVCMGIGAGLLGAIALVNNLPQQRRHYR